MYRHTNTVHYSSIRFEAIRDTILSTVATHEYWTFHIQKTTENFATLKKMSLVWHLFPANNPQSNRLYSFFLFEAIKIIILPILMSKEYSL